MLIEPASKASVPLTVVTRTMFSVPESATDPFDTIFIALSVLAQLELATHVFDVILEMTICPVKTVAFAIDVIALKPAVEAVVVEIVEAPNVLAIQV